MAVSAPRDRRAESGSGAVDIATPARPRCCTTAARTVRAGRPCPDCIPQRPLFLSFDAICGFREPQKPPFPVYLPLSNLSAQKLSDATPIWGSTIGKLRDFRLALPDGDRPQGSFADREHRKVVRSAQDYVTSNKSTISPRAGSIPPAGWCWSSRRSTSDERVT